MKPELWCVLPRPRPTPPYAECGRMAGGGIHRNRRMHLNEAERFIEACQARRTATMVPDIDHPLAVIEAERFPQGREGWRPADEETAVAVVGEHIEVALDHLRPRTDIWMVTVVAEAADRRCVVRDNIGAHQAEQVCPVPRAGSHLHQGRVPPYHPQQVWLGKHVREALRQPQSVSILSGDLQPAGKAPAERIVRCGFGRRDQWTAHRFSVAGPNPIGGQKAA
jgi:hypothetical protein